VTPDVRLAEVVSEPEGSAPDAPVAEPVTPIEPVVLARLRTTPPASPLHLALVEVVRRRYIAFRKDMDRRDKEMIRARQP
jgi:hypothetical protein